LFKNCAVFSYGDVMMSVENENLNKFNSIKNNNVLI
jgi:hypothetical protein